MAVVSQQNETDQYTYSELVLEVAEASHPSSDSANEEVEPGSLKSSMWAVSVIFEMT